MVIDNASEADDVSGRVTRRAVGSLGLGLAAGTTVSRVIGAENTTIPQDTRWTVFYGQHASHLEFAGFDTVILDPGFASPLELLTAGGARTFGYLSLGEIRRSAPLFDKLTEHTMLLGDQPAWPGTSRVDLRSPAWTSLVLQEAVPAIVERGFSGLFLDTIDTPLHLETTDRLRFAGMQVAAVALVRAIRDNVPHMPIIMNRGYTLLPELTGSIDAVIAESCLTTYDFATKTNRWVSPESVVQVQALLRPARDRRIPILSLDYWDPGDIATIRTIYQRERSLGHAPYVSTILLDRIYHEPRG